MTSKKRPNKIRSNYPTLENVPEKLRSARTLAQNVPNVIFDFVEYMADIAMKKSKYHITFIAETMWNLVFDAKDHIEEQRDDGIPIPKKLKGKMPEIRKNIEYFYLLIDKISSKEFAERFRKLDLLGNK